jgi:epoxyqueuosine reductase
LAHYKDETAIGDLIKVMTTDPRPVIRGTAAWALGKIGGEESLSALELALQQEKDEEVLAEIENGLSYIEQ